MTDAEKYQWLKANCIMDIPADREGPQFKQLVFQGKCYPDWKFAIDHVGLDQAIEDEAARQLERK